MFFVDNPPVLVKTSPEPLAKSGDGDIQVKETRDDLVPSSRRRSTKPKKYVDSGSESDAGNGRLQTCSTFLHVVPISTNCTKTQLFQFSDRLVSHHI